MAVFANVFLGMQLPLSSYLQVCFSITNDVVMSICLMFERPEAGTQLFLCLCSDNPHIFTLRFDAAQAAECTD